MTRTPTRRVAVIRIPLPPKQRWSSRRRLLLLQLLKPERTAGFATAGIGLVGLMVPRTFRLAELPQTRVPSEAPRPPVGPKANGIVVRFNT